MSYESIGFAYFPSGELNSPGVACVNGGSLNLFDNLIVLRNTFPNSIFITNVRAKNYAIGIADNYDWLKHENYFETSLTELMHELNIEALTETNFNSVKLISNILKRVFEVANRGTSTSLNLNAESFSQALMTMTSSIETAPISTALSLPLTRLMLMKQKHLKSINNTNQKKKNIRLNMNRLKRLKDALKINVPCGSWEEIVLENKSTVLKDGIQRDKSILALVGVSKIDGGLSRLLSEDLGLGELSWVASDELRILSNYAKVRVHRAFQCTSQKPVLNTFVKELPEFTPFDYAAISSGLFAESFLDSACITGDIEMAINKGDLRPAWLYSWARATALQEAINLTRSGFKVASVSINNIQIEDTSIRSDFDQSFNKSLRSYVDKQDVLYLPLSFLSNGR